MPCDDDLLIELGRVPQAAARLHAGVRDAANRHDGHPSDDPSEWTLGHAVSRLESRAISAKRADQVDWIKAVGRPAVKMRNAVTHAVTYTAFDG